MKILLIEPAKASLTIGGEDVLSMNHLLSSILRQEYQGPLCEDLDLRLEKTSREFSETSALMLSASPHIRFMSIQLKSF